MELHLDDDTLRSATESAIENVLSDAVRKLDLGRTAQEVLSRGLRDLDLGPLVEGAIAQVDRERLTTILVREVERRMTAGLCMILERAIAGILVHVADSGFMTTEQRERAINETLAEMRRRGEQAQEREGG